MLRPTGRGDDSHVGWARSVGSKSGGGLSFVYSGDSTPHHREQDRNEREFKLL